MTHPACREMLTINIEGGNADNHEISAEALGNSLVALSSFLTKASNIVYGKSCTVSVNVKGGFKEGSFEYQVIIDLFAGSVPLIPEMVKTVIGFWDLIKFLGGKKPEGAEPAQEQEHMCNIVNITNSHGEIKPFPNSLVVMNNNASVNLSFNGLLNPLDHGACSMTLSNTEDDKQRTFITSEEKREFLTLSSEIISQEEIQRTLEVLTSHMDGKSTNWRFYDPEDDTEYSANIDDQEFLESVRDGRQSFQHGSKISATVCVTKKLVKERKRTERILSNIRAVSEEEIA